jgi:hypothetical protein
VNKVVGKTERDGKIKYGHFQPGKTVLGPIKLGIRLYVPIL